MMFRILLFANDDSANEFQAKEIENKKKTENLSFVISDSKLGA